MLGEGGGRVCPSRAPAPRAASGPRRSAPFSNGNDPSAAHPTTPGAIEFINAHYNLDAVHLRGASAGGLAVTLAACGVPARAALASAASLAADRALADRRLGLAGVWGDVVRDWLHALLPADAAARCAGRLKLVVTEVPSLRLATLDAFACKDDVVNACLASAHVPFFLDGRPFARYRGRALLDGSLHDFIRQNNSHHLTAGDAYVLDYAHDDELDRDGRFAFLKNVDEAGAAALMDAGAAYARRQLEAGVLDRHFGSVRRDGAAAAPAVGLSA